LARAEPLLEHRDLLTRRNILRSQECSGAKQITHDPEEQGTHRARAFLKRGDTSMIDMRMRFFGGTGHEASFSAVIHQ
jgi:hypothetical protein